MRFGKIMFFRYNDRADRPAAYFCFLDHCGKVCLYPAEKDAVLPSDEEEEPDGWQPEDQEPEESFFEEKPKYSDLYRPEI